MIVPIFGTRPEAIKLGPVVAALRGVKVTPVCTGQHTTLLHGTPVDDDLADARSLSHPSLGKVDTWLAGIADPLHDLVRSLEPSVIVVVGDTMSALAGAIVADRLGIPLAHLEAGVRSHNLKEPFPEEGFRVEIDRLATYYYAPTTTAYANLVAEGRPQNRIRLTGNPVVSAIARYTTVKPSPLPLRTIFLTLHRREWLEGPYFFGTVAGITRAAELYPDLTILWPMHPAVKAKAGKFDHPQNLKLLSPLPYAAGLALLAPALGVITDSGGIQEEAATLGVPCAVARNVTDRPESIQAGVAKLVGADGWGVRRGIHVLDEQELLREPLDLYGTPESASLIAHHLASIA